MALIHSATSTGTTSALNFDAPVSKVAWQSVGTATVAVEGSLGGDSWFTIAAASTSPANTINTSTGSFLAAKVRLVVSAYGSTTGGIRLVGV